MAKIIAFYLPQFHTISENDEWWGKGFTEWVNVKAAKPLFDNHYQPRVPLNNNYYNLLDNNTLKWQIDLAKEYGIYGFCFYHYWFNGHMLLEKPMENFYNDKELNMPYCICWANEAWTNAWKHDEKPTTLIEQSYGNKKEWKEHFDYLLKFFKDKNYIVEDKKPLFVIYRPEIIPCLNEMLDYWNELAIENGFNGINFAYQQITFDLDKNKDDSRFRYNIEYQPAYARYDLKNNTENYKKKLLFKLRQNIRNLITIIDKKLGTSFMNKIQPHSLKFEDYEELCKQIVNRKATDEKSVAGFFVGWDNTPRREERGTVCLNSTPEIFEKYLKLQVENIEKNYQNDYLFMFAWNEWAEGGYLEPDEKYKYEYLNSIKKIQKERKK